MCNVVLVQLGSLLLGLLVVDGVGTRWFLPSVFQSRNSLTPWPRIAFVQRRGRLPPCPEGIFPRYMDSVLVCWFGGKDAWQIFARGVENGGRLRAVRRVSVSTPRKSGMDGWAHRHHRFVAQAHVIPSADRLGVHGLVWFQSGFPRGCSLSKYICNGPLAAMRA